MVGSLLALSLAMHDHGEDENGCRGYDYHGYGEKDPVDNAIQLVLLFFG